MDDKSILTDDEGSPLFPETETRRLAERFAPRPAGMRAIEQELRRPPAPLSPPGISDVLIARNAVHGDFTNDARTSQALKHVMHEGKNWDDLTFVQKEALEHVATKIGRILSGDPNHKDHWSDIQGYARLVEERL